MTSKHSAEAIRNHVGSLEYGLARLDGLTRVLFHMSGSESEIETSALDAMAYAFTDVARNLREHWEIANEMAFDACRDQGAKQ